jgi:hypothetical protein
MQRLHTDLDTALADANPLSRLGPIQEAVMRKIGDAIDKGIWLWSPPFPESPTVDLELDRRIADIRRRFKDLWSQPPGGVI